MNILSNLTPNDGSTKKRKRIGRGQGSGQGRTAGKGNKGQKARSGGSIRRGFEGGQMPLHRRVPKFGFYNRFMKTYGIISLETLAKTMPEGGDINIEVLIEKGLIASDSTLLKILGNGKIQAKYNICADKVSASAKKSIEEKGGSIDIIEKRSKIARITLGQLARNFKSDGSGSPIKVTVESIRKAGLLASYKEKVEIIAVGKINTKYSVEVHKVSRAARKIIETSGGKVIVIDPAYNYRKIDFNDLRKWFPKGGEISPDTLMQKGVLKKDQRVTLVDKGRIYGVYDVKLHRVSNAAIEKLVHAGGQVQLIEQ
jgi:large subunit ribosomal protein L15